MNIVKKYDICSSSDIIFTKVDMNNFFKRENYKYSDFLIFSFIELANNILKYTKSGYVWLLQQDNKFALCCFDYGDGIEDLDLALSDGFTTGKNSLGLGLYQLAKNENFDMQIYTNTKLKYSGTVVLVSEKEIKEDIVFLTKAYMDLDKNGDYFKSKGRYMMFGDVSGHGVKAQKSAIKIKDFFMKEFLSFSLASDFFNQLDKFLKLNELRSTVICVIQKKMGRVEIAGVGNIGLWVEKKEIFDKESFKDGIVGEVFFDFTVKTFELKKHQQLILTTDGLNTIKLKEYLDTIINSYTPLMNALCSLHFSSSSMDDSSILIIEG